MLPCLNDKKIKFNIIRLLLIIIFLISHSTYAATIGSNTMVSRQTLPAAFNGVNNTMLGFAFFEQGFTLASSVTTVTFTDVFPIYRTISLSGGSLFLNVDTTLDVTSVITSAGSFYGNSFQLIFPCQPNAYQIPQSTTPVGVANNSIFNNITLVFNSPTTFNLPSVFQGNCMICGNNQTLTLAPNALIRVTPGSTLVIKNLEIQGVGGNNIRGDDNTSTFMLDDVQWILDANFTFSNGQFIVSNEFEISGTYVFTYQSSKTSTINSSGTLMLDDGLTFSYAPPTASRNLIAMTDSTSQIYLAQTSVFSTATGWQLTKGTLVVDGTCIFTNSASVANEGFIFGDGTTAANDLSITILPESGITLASGFINYRNVNQ